MLNHKNGAVNSRSVMRKNKERNILLMLMRVLFSKIHCPSFICFGKPSPALLYTQREALKLENTSTATAPPVISSPVTCKSNGVNEEISGDSIVDGKGTTTTTTQKNLKSCLKVSCPLDSKHAKKKVQWLDFLGKELVQMKEFESSETEDSDSEDQSNKGCSCMIL